MAIQTGDVMGHSLVGVHLTAIGDVLFAPYGVDKTELEMIASGFDLEPVRLTIGGSSLVGSLMAVLGRVSQ